MARWRLRVWPAGAELVTRSAHRLPHHSAFLWGGEAQVVAEQVMSSSPAARAQDSRRRPASGSVAVRDLPVKVKPAVQPILRRVPGHGRKVGVPSRDIAARLAHPAHLPQRGNRLCQVLEDLMGMYHANVPSG